MPFPLERLTRAVERQNAGDLVGAQGLYWEILLDDPAQFDALHLMGVSLCQQGAQVRGAWFIARALEVRDDAGAQYNLGTALAELHRHEEAVGRFDRALALRADYAEAWASRGDALQRLVRNAEAVACYRRALQLRPDLPGTLSNLGTALLTLGRAEEALVLFEQAMAAGAARGAVLIHVARAEVELGRDAGATWRAACEAAPDAAEPRWQAAAAVLPDIPGTEAAVAASRVAYAAALDGIQAWYAADAGGRRDRTQLAMPFFLAYQDHDNSALMRRFGALRCRLMAGMQPPLPTRGRRAGRLKVAVVSPHLYSHSVWHAIARGWFAHMDPVRVALHAVHTGVKSDVHTTFARERAAGFIHGQRSLAQWIEVIAALAADVILYPAIGMDDVTANLASLRLAPVQLATWGHPETTGFPTIDGYLSGAAFEPAGAEAHYTERLIRLPGLGASFMGQGAEPVPPDLVALGLDAARPILLCPGTPFKYAPGHDATLAAIARAVPGAQLVFFGMKDNSVKPARLLQRIAGQFAAEGLDGAAHLRLIPFQPIGRFYGLLRQATLCLDTIGFSGFNTALQAVGNACPYVAYEGRFMRGRLASGLLREIGLDECVAGTPEAFVSIVAGLVADPARRGAIARHLAGAVPALYDDPRPVHALTDILEGMIP